MKTFKYIILSIAILCNWPVKSQQNQTLIIVDEKDNKTEVSIPDINIMVNENEDTVSIITLGRRKFEFIEDDDNLKIRMTKSPREKFKGHFAGFDMGFCNYLNSDFSTSLTPEDQFMELNSGKSVHVGINFLQYSIGLQKNRNNLGLVTGMGLNYYNYRFDSDYILVKDPDSGETTYSISPYPVEKNKLLTTYLNIPLLLELQLPSRGDHRFFINAGGFCGFNLDAHTKVIYDVDGTSNKRKSHANLNVRPVQYGLTTRFGYRFLKLYANYNLSSLFEQNQGPELYPLTVGITFINL
jgi:hypothetical protein